MARRWNLEEVIFHRDELHRLYIDENKTISKVGTTLGIAESSVFQRLKRLGIATIPEKKLGYRGGLKKIKVPSVRSDKLAEFLGLMLGDGHVSHFQVVVTLGTKELPYVDYVSALMSELFQTPATTIVRGNGYRDVYIGSVKLTSWLKSEGLVSNKVAAQVAAPEWIFTSPDYMKCFLRGFFDTDGSIYRLKFGMQISLTNHSVPLLISLRRMLVALQYRPSEVSGFRVYLTRKIDVSRFFQEVKPANMKHLRRFEFISVKYLTRRYPSG